MIKLKDPEGYERTLRAFAEFAAKHVCDENEDVDFPTEEPHQYLSVRSDVHLSEGDAGTVGAAYVELAIETGCSLNVFHWSFEGKKRISFQAYMCFYVESQEVAA